MTAVAIRHREKILDRLAEGERLGDIAPDLGVSSANSISKVLKNDPEYRNAIEAGFHKRLDLAEDAIKNSTDNVDVVRARARFQSVAWRAEREFPETWGQRQTLMVDHRITIDEAISRDAAELLPRVIEGVVVDNSSAGVTDGALSALCQPDSLDASLPTDCAGEDDV